MSLKVIHTKNLRWIDIINPGEKELDMLKTHYKFHPLDYEDVLSTSQHAKIEDRNDYKFLVLLFPYFNQKTREILPAEVDFFIGKDYLITIHDGSMHTMLNAFENAHKHDAIRSEYMGKNSGYLLYQLLEFLFKRSFPILDHINKDMTGIEKNIFGDLSIKMLEEISLMKRNIIDFRRIMKTHHLIIKRLMNKKDAYLNFHDSKDYYASVLDQAENIWDILAIQKETIEALQDANQSLATNRLNDITKVVAIFSAVFGPATIIMFLFGLNVNAIPLKEDPYAFWIILGMATAASSLMLAYFKHKKWY